MRFHSEPFLLTLALCAATSSVHAQQRFFSILAGPLEAALAGYRQATGLAIHTAIPIASLKSPGTQGSFSDADALAQLLTGTGLSAQPTPGGFTLGLQASENVTVHADDTLPEIALDRYPAPLLDTPQSITVVSAQTIHDQGATTLRDTLRNAPGISLAAGEGGSQGDNLTLRGFTARNDIFLDGFRDFGSYYRDPFDYEQVEVLEGPSSVAFGRGSTGGVINQESKPATLRPFVHVDTEGGTDLTRRLAVDWSQPLSETAALRLNAVGHESDVAARDVTENRRFGIAPELAFGLGTPTRLKLDYFHLNENDIPDYGIPWYLNKPAPVARHNYYGFREGNYLRTAVDQGTIRLERDLAGWAILRDKLRYSRDERNARITEPQLNNASAGSILPSTPLDQILVSRNQIAVYSNETLFWDQLDTTVRVNTFGLRHSAVIGAEGGRETSDPRRPTYNSAVATVAGKPTLVNSVPLTSLLHPEENQGFAGTPLFSSNVHATSLSWGVYLLDTIQLGQKWELTGGGRYDSFGTDVKNINYTPKIVAGAVQQGAPAITYPYRLDHRPSWRSALTYKPVPNGSVYFGYGTSWNPSAETLALTVGPNGSGTANLAPEINCSYEAGTKWDLRNSRLSLRADLFRTTKDNARESSPANSLLYVLAGTQRVEGAEAAVTGRVTDRWQILSSYTFLHSRVVNSRFYPQAVGYKLANVPDNLFNLWTTYQPTTRWVLGGGGNYVASRNASSTVPLDPTTGLVRQVPGYVVLNGLASYSLNEHANLQANIFNLTNASYIDQIHPGHLVPGSGASALVGLNLKF